MSDAAVLYEVSDYIATITLNRPENRNSMTEDILEGILDATGRVRKDESVRCVVITGRGKSFCAGADFKSGAQRGGRRSSSLPNDRSFAMYEPFLSVLDIEVPVVGALNGHAIGGGMGLGIAAPRVGLLAPDVSVVGHDDVDLGNRLRPSLDLVVELQGGGHRGLSGGDARVRLDVVGEDRLGDAAAGAAVVYLR